MNTPSPQATPADGRAPALIVFAVALIVRLLYLHQAAAGPTFMSPIVDSETYLELARRLANSGSMGQDFFWQPFFYQAFLTCCTWLSTNTIVFAKVAQALLGALTAALTVHLARHMTGPRTALAAGLIVALYGPLVFFDGELLATGWAAFWLVSLPLLAFRLRHDPSPRTALGYGAAAALGILTRPTFMPIVLAGLLWAPLTGHWRGRLGPRRAAAMLALALVAAAILLAPVAHLSRRHTGAVSILPYSGGINLFIGNNPNSVETVAMRPGWQWDNLTRMPARDGVPPGRPSARYFAGRVREYITRHPLHFAAGIADKAIQFVSSRELPRNIDIYVYRQWSPLLELLVWKAGSFGFPFGVLLPLAVVGLVARFRQFGGLLPITMLLYAGAVVLVFVTSRYRVPLVPLLAIPAAAGAGWLIGALRDHPRRLRYLLPALALGILLMTQPGPFPQESPHYESELYYCLARQSSHAGDAMAAESHLRRALNLHPVYPDAWNSLGVALERQHRPREAADAYDAAVQFDPRHLTARMNLASMLYRLERYDAAAHHYRTALSLNPQRADAHDRLALIAVHEQRFEEAVHHFHQSLQLTPTRAAAHNNLASALIELGRTAEAIQYFEAAIMLDPNLEVAVDNLGAAFVAMNEHAQARLLYRAALQRAIDQGQPARAAALQRRLDALAPATAPVGP